MRTRPLISRRKRADAAPDIGDRIGSDRKWIRIGSEEEEEVKVQ